MTLKFHRGFSRKGYLRIRHWKIYTKDVKFLRNGKSENGNKDGPGRRKSVWEFLKAWRTMELLRKWMGAHKSSLDVRRIMTCVNLKQLTGIRKLERLKTIKRNMMFILKIMGKSVSFKQESNTLYDLWFWKSPLAATWRTAEGKNGSRETR